MTRQPMDFLSAMSAYARVDNEGTSANKAIKLATVDPAHDPESGNLPKLTFDGESTLSGKRYPYLKSYTPLPSDRVVLIPCGNTYLIVGAVFVSAPWVPYDSQVFTNTAGGTWTKPDGARWGITECQGGAGGGGGAPTTAASQTSAGSGGQGGGYARRFWLAADVTNTVAVAVGVAGTITLGAAGGNGGTSSWGSYCSATGGAGGSITAASGSPGAVAGGWQAQTLTGDVTIVGTGGGAGARLGAGGSIGGQGGNSHLGGGGGGSGNGSAARTGSNYGGGGGGATREQSTTQVAGGGAGQGIVRVFTYF
jgi:hypothetical protein